MSAAGNYLVYLTLAVSCRENVVFLSHFLSTELRFVKTAASCSGEILAYHRVEVIARKRLLCEQYLSACTLLNSAEYLKICPQLSLVNDIAGRRELCGIKHFFHITLRNHSS